MAGKLWHQIVAGCLTLTIIGGVSSIIGSADELSDYEKRQKELDKQAQEYQSIIDQTASDIAQKEEYKEALLNKISVLNEQIANGRAEIESLDTEISGLQTEIDESKEAIEDRMETLRARVKVIYLSGETTSLEIILGAKSFEDFLDKLEIVSFISNSDEKMITELQSDIDVINKKREQLETKKSQLDEEQAKLDTRNEELQELVNKNQEMLDGLYVSNAQAQDHLDENTAERKEIEDAIAAYFADQEAQRQNAELASKKEQELAESRKELEESQKAEQSKVSSIATSGKTESDYDDTSSRYESDVTSSQTTTSREESSSRVSSQTSSKVSSQTPSKVPSQEPSSEPSSEEPSSSEAVSSEEYYDPPVYDSGYVWPTPGHYYLTSEWNEDRGSYNHGAIDIADGSIMNADVVAAESGVVVLSNNSCTHNYAKDGSCGCGGGYGNYLMIDHGNGKATLYAHLTSLTVSSGSYVQKGQLIGYVGSTGWSTGAHLHFETRLNGVKYNPMTEYPNM